MGNWKEAHDREEQKKLPVGEKRYLTPRGGGNLETSNLVEWVGAEDRAKSPDIHTVRDGGSPPYR